MNGLKLDRFLSIIADKSVIDRSLSFHFIFYYCRKYIKERGKKKQKLKYFGKYFLRLLRYIYYAECLKIFETF